MLFLATGLLLAANVPPEVEFGMPSRELGKPEGRCRPAEPGPAVVATITGLKDRAGYLRAELYAANDAEFLGSDKELVRAGKLFRRTEITMPPSGPVQICIRVPAPGAYSLSILHDRDGNRKFGLSSDGIGFPGNPRLGLAKPRAAMATVKAGNALTDIDVRMNYRQGLFSFGPLKKPR